MKIFRVAGHIISFAGRYMFCMELRNFPMKQMDTQLKANFWIKCSRNYNLILMKLNLTLVFAQNKKKQGKGHLRSVGYRWGFFLPLFSMSVLDSQCLLVWPQYFTPNCNCQNINIQFFREQGTPLTVKLNSFLSYWGNELIPVLILPRLIHVPSMFKVHDQQISSSSNLLMIVLWGQSETVVLLKSSSSSSS